MAAVYLASTSSNFPTGAWHKNVEDTCFDTDSPDRFVTFAKPLRSLEKDFSVALATVSTWNFHVFLGTVFRPNFDRSALSICAPPIDCLTSRCLQESERPLLSHFCQGLALKLCARLSSFKVIGPNILFETRFDADSPDRFVAYAKYLR